ncbi:hypothetical protein [Methanospirillum lacunae]|uniref:Uncharacterized protein n=1 Tax=Methanospirillum lacunae TaxID=668570 RepID=A0A2V2MVU3_9EURY|nr:hypothetical protein [Methanospirillum lacunae]PWR70355.1 hypothetical protein DK846_14845 [Methanospirillum lacunae]
MSNNAIKVVSILFAVMIILLPMSWAFVVTQTPGPYFATESNQVLDALKAAGLNYCEQTESTWQVTGAQGGKSVRISSDCSKKSSDTTIFIHTQKFDSAQDRDDAVRLIQKTINMNDLNGGVYTYGSYVIAVQGPTGGKPISETLSQVKAALQK